MNGMRAVLEDRQKLFDRALHYINNRCNGKYWPYVEKHPEGYAWFRAYIFKIRDGLWFVADMKHKTIRRICT